MNPDIQRSLIAIRRIVLDNTTASEDAALGIAAAVLFRLERIGWRSPNNKYTRVLTRQDLKSLGG